MANISIYKFRQPGRFLRACHAVNLLRSSGLILPNRVPRILVYQPRDSGCVTGQTFAQCRSTLPLGNNVLGLHIIFMGLIYTCHLWTLRSSSGRQNNIGFSCQVQRILDLWIIVHRGSGMSLIWIYPYQNIRWFGQSAEARVEEEILDNKVGPKSSFANRKPCSCLQYFPTFCREITLVVSFSHRTFLGSKDAEFVHYFISPLRINGWITQELPHHTRSTRLSNTT